MVYQTFFQNSSLYLHVFIFFCFFIVSCSLCLLVLRLVIVSRASEESELLLPLEVAFTRFFFPCFHRNGTRIEFGFYQGGGEGVLAAVLQR